MNPYLAPGVAITVDLDIEYVQLYIPTQAVLIEADRNSPAEVLEIPHDAVTENHGYFTIKVYQFASSNSIMNTHSPLFKQTTHVFAFLFIYFWGGFGCFLPIIVKCQEICALFVDLRI